MGPLGLGAPMIEGGDRVHPLRNARRVKLDLAFLIDNDITPADLRLERFDLGTKLAVGFEKIPLDHGALPLTGVGCLITTA